MRVFIFDEQTLYDYGARKVAVMGVGQVGCSPSELARYSANGATCIDNINSAIQIFNNKVRSLVSDLNSNLADAKFTYIDGYGIFADIVRRASQFGNNLDHSFANALFVGVNLIMN